MSRWWLAAAAVASLVATAAPMRAEDVSPPGMRMYRDPESGALGGPPPGVARRSTQAKIAASAAGEPEPVSAPAGGLKLKLGGRFQAAIRRHADLPGDPPLHECVQQDGRAHE